MKKHTSDRRIKAVIELSKLCDKNGVYILPRHGFLLGIIRHKGFLPNEEIDMDVVIYHQDVEKIKKCNWSPFEIKFYDLPDYCKKGRIGNSFFNGLHPLTAEKLYPAHFHLRHIPSDISFAGGIIFDYKPGNVYYPLDLAETNYKNEVKLNMVYHEKWSYEGGFKILGEKEYPLTLEFLKVKPSDEGWGKVGTIYELTDWFPVKKSKFYEYEINVPSNSEKILKTDYGKNCLTVMIDKSGKTKNITNYSPKNMQFEKFKIHRLGRAFIRYFDNLR